MTPSILILWVATLAFAVMRFSGITGGLFKVAAHLFVGALFGAYCATHDRRYIFVFVFLATAEVIAFTLSRVL